MRHNRDTPTGRAPTMNPMDTTATPTIAPIRLPLQVWLGALASALLLFVMLQDNGVLLHNTLLNAHEFFHDGRHLLGVPCH